jgi:hypothetical protein
MELLFVNIKKNALTDSLKVIIVFVCIINSRNFSYAGVGLETNRRWKNIWMSFELNLVNGVRLVGSSCVRISFQIGYLICVPEIPRRNKLSFSKSSTISTESLISNVITSIGSKHLEVTFLGNSQSIHPKGPLMKNQFKDLLLSS